MKQHLIRKRENCAPCTKDSAEVKIQGIVALEAVRQTKTAKEAKLQSDIDEVAIGKEANIEQSHA